MRRFLAVTAALLALAAFTVGCSSSSGSSKASSSPTTAAGAATKGPTTAQTDALKTQAGLTGAVNFDDDPTNRVATPAAGATVQVEVSDYYIGPTYISAKGGSTLHLVLTNAGKATHSFTIDSLHIDKVLSPGQKATVDVTVPATGSVRFYCKFHAAMGMQGAIIAVG